MTTGPDELITAASQGAAAAVAAVQDEQLKESIVEDSNLAANFAAEAAGMAAEESAIAVDTSREAASIAESAAMHAMDAGETAQVAAEVAFNAQDEITRMRQEFDERREQDIAGFRAMLEEFRPKQSAEPTEVTVNDTRPNSGTQESGANPRSGQSSGNGRRHRFGKRV